MVFSSIVFLLYFLPAFLLVYFLTDRKYKNYIILAFSLFFYAWGAPKFVYVILLTTFVDYHIVNLIHRSEGRQRKLFLFLSISVNLGLLLFFKYSNFFVENLNSIFASLGVTPVKWMYIMLPIGISFFTFETLTYSIDVYRRVHAPLKRFRDYLLYIILFPKLIAGPIVRFSEIADQVEDRQNQETIDNKIYGFYRFIIGLAKKVLIANTMGKFADEIFATEISEMSGADAWLGIIAYSFQIYFDFSGYSDMALGIARMIGFKFPENFNNPYISQSISEFWRRWHMTLGRWMRDYLYIPLGGNRISGFRLYFNLWFVFLISGLWHGASWNFITWGAFHGLFLIADRLFLLNFYKRIGKIPSIIVTYIIVLVGWVFFRADTLSQSIHYLGVMFDFTSFGLTKYIDLEVIITLCFAFFFSFLAILPGIEKWQNIFFNLTYSLRLTLFMGLICVSLLLVCISYVAVSSFNPFIYFRF